MKLEDVAYSITMFTVILFLSPYLDRIPIWISMLFMAVLVISLNPILSKIKFLQKSVSKKVGWPTILIVCIIVGALNNLIN
ncbi:hypothetical protein ACQKL5_08225 [Peribacillus sp. NPDC097675]|uniref:hypothetical protein n=1 Tax=Peribacillus sp. NPDC097675 TaxID=3390618 RepID=UPI003CFD23BD